MKNLFLMALVGFALAGCGGGSNNGNGDGGNSAPGSGGSSSSTYKYQFVENGCDTGQQVFSSQSAMCSGVQNESLNHGCAGDLRQQYFTAQGCTGTYQPS